MCDCEGRRCAMEGGVYLSGRQVALLATMMSGLQAPRSLGPAVLGAATRPFDELRSELGLFGWQTKEEVEEVIRRRCSSPTSKT